MSDNIVIHKLTKAQAERIGHPKLAGIGVWCILRNENEKQPVDKDTRIAKEVRYNGRNGKIIASNLCLDE